MDISLYIIGKSVHYKTLIDFKKIRHVIIMLLECLTQVTSIQLSTLFLSKGVVEEQL